LVLRPAASITYHHQARARGLELGGAGIIVSYRQTRFAGDEALEAKNRIQAVVVAIRDGSIAP